MGLMKAFTLALQVERSHDLPWIGMFIMGLIIYGGVALGLKGFRDQSIPFTKNSNITGTSAQIVGVLCFAIGLGGLLGLAMMILGSL